MNKSEQIKAAKVKFIDDMIEQDERVEAAISKVKARKMWLSIYMAKQGMESNDLGRHKVANKYAFKLCSRFDCGMSDLRQAFKEVFRTE